MNRIKKILSVREAEEFLSGQQRLTAKTVGRALRMFYGTEFSLGRGKFVEINFSPELYYDADKELKNLHKKQGFMFTAYLKYPLSNRYIVDRDREYALFYEPFSGMVYIFEKKAARTKRIIPFWRLDLLVNPLKFSYQIHKMETDDFNVVFSRRYTLCGNKLKAFEDEAMLSQYTKDSMRSRWINFPAMDFVFTGYSTIESWKERMDDVIWD